MVIEWSSYWKVYCRQLRQANAESAALWPALSWRWQPPAARHPLQLRPAPRARRKDEAGWLSCLPAGTPLRGEMTSDALSWHGLFHRGGGPPRGMPLPPGEAATANLRAGLSGRVHEQRRPQLDRQLHLGHRRRRAPRPLRPRQVPRRDPADDRAAPPRRRAGADQAGRARHEGVARQGEDRPTRTRRCGRRPARRSTTPRSSRCATSGPAPASSSSRPTSRPTSTASRRTSRTSSTTSSSATRSRASPRPTRSAR